MILTNHEHELNASQRIFGRLKGLESKHRLGDTLNGTVILLHGIIQILDLANSLMDRQRTSEYIPK